MQNVFRKLTWGIALCSFFIGRLAYGGELQENDSIQKEQSVELKELMITGTRKHDYAGKSVYTFSKIQVQNSRHAEELLKGIRELTMDVNTGKLKTLDGKKLTLLLNGVKATDNDLKSIAPEKVIRVEYYTMPPARYASDGIVVNVVTRRLDTGWTGGIDVVHAFTTGFGNDNLYLRHVWGNNQFSFDYGLNFRSYRNRRYTENYHYLLENRTTDYENNGKDKFGYTTNEINLKYTRLLQDNYMLQVTFSPNFDTRFSDAENNILVKVEDEPEPRIGKRHEHIRSFGPVADLYFSKSFPHRQEIIFDLTGTLYHNKQDKDNLETAVNDQQVFINDNMHLENNKKSLIGELAYTKQWNNWSLSAGYKGTLALSSSTIRNFLSAEDPYRYTSSNDSHYAYVEAGGHSRIFTWRIGMGGTLVDTSNDDASFHKFVLNPRLNLACELSSGQSLQLAVSSSPEIPTISQLSNNVTLITTGLVTRGNPYLRTGNTYSSALKYELNARFINLTFGGTFVYTSLPIGTYYEEDVINDTHYIVFGAKNGDYSCQYGLDYMMQLKPFGSELLVIKLSGNVLKQRNKSVYTGRYSHLYAPFYYSVNFRKGNWGVSYDGNIVSKQLFATYLFQDENESNLELSYQFRHIRLMAGCYWLFTKSRYAIRTIPNPVLSTHSNTYINDNRSMFVVGFSWELSSGKKLDGKRKIQNRDVDKGTF